MYALFARYYDNVDPGRFARDLAEKDWVILLRNEAQRIVGFSTLQTYPHAGVLGRTMILYSGDTIMDRAYRHRGALAGAFGHFLLRTIEACRELPFYWFLTSKGARTYRFLPVFFRAFAPAFNRPTPPAMKRLVDEVAAAKFGARYAPETQIVVCDGERDRLCEAEQDPLLLQRDDPHIRFFLERNPGHARGDELVCMAEISAANLNARARRVIAHTEVHWRE